MSGQPSGEIILYQRGGGNCSEIPNSSHEQPSDAEKSYLDTVKAVQKKISGKKNHEPD